MKPFVGRVFDSTVIALLIIQLTGCGTLLYPERKGQKAGHVDVGVFLLDAIGLLFFLIPGIIAFAVDFSNGTIYLPPTAVGPRTQLRKIKFDPKRTTVADIEKIIKEETGHTVKMNPGNMRISRLNSNEEMMNRFAQAQVEIQNNRLAFARQ
jgi:hypothetical protein